MGGIIIFIADRDPVPDPVDYDWRAVGVFGAAIACALLGFADDYTKIVKRRSLGLRARTKLGVTIAISIWLWWVAHQQGRPARHAAPALRRRARSTSASSTRCSSTSWSRARRARSTSPTASTASPAGCAAIVLLAYIGITFITHRPAGPRAARAAAWSARASASCGSTRSRRRSSWATPGRSGSAARSPAWR